MPTLEDLERRVRRRAIGRTIEEICRDLAVVPGLCTAAFWNDLFQAIHYFGGSVETLRREKSHREQAFIQKQNKKRDSTWDRLKLKRDEIRQIVGFFIGEPPVDPFAAPLATGPPWPLRAIAAGSVREVGLWPTGYGRAPPIIVGAEGSQKY